ncbi:hypothetical protein D3C72_2300640 [compost metagenome]
MLLKPLEVLVDVGGIDDKHVALLTKAVDKQVINDPAVWIQHKSILCRTVSQPADIVRRHLLQKSL